MSKVKALGFLMFTAWSLGLSGAPAGSAERVISTVAGGGPVGIPALQANLASPQAVAFGPEGDLYIAAGWAHRVFRVDSLGIIHVVAGCGGDRSFSGDGGPAREANLYFPTGIAFDLGGNLVIVDTFNYRIRRVDRTTGIIETIAGAGPAGGAGDGGPATEATFRLPTGLAYDGSGNLYIVDQDDNRVRKVDAVTGNIDAFAGTGQGGFGGDSGPATAAQLNRPTHVAVDAAGVVYITDTDNHRVRKVGTDGKISTLVDPSPQIHSPSGLALHGSSLYFSDSGTIYRKDLLLGTLGIVQNSGLNLGPLGLGGLAADASGRVLVADSGNNRVVAVGSALQLVAGNGQFLSSGDGFPANRASMDITPGVALDGQGALIIAERRIRRVDPATGIISTLGGNGQYGYGGDGGPATNAPIAPDFVTTDSNGNVFFSECSNNRVRRIDAQSGIISTVAGNGEFGFGGDAGPATGAMLECPAGIAFDPDGSLLIADEVNQRVRRVDAGTGIITTIVGTGQEGFAGDGGPAAQASLDFPGDLAVDTSGNLYIADWFNFRIRKVAAGTGVISTIAGTGEMATGEDGQIASLTPIEAAGIGLDLFGNLFFVEVGRVRRIDAATNILTTVAGSGLAGFSGDGGPALLAKMDDPLDVAVAPGGDLYVSDFFNARIRRISLDAGLPVADAGNDLQAGCEATSGASVTLDGSRSGDPDSSPGTNDDIVMFEWYEHYGALGEELLGTGEMLTLSLPSGAHAITLRVTDHASATDTDEITVTVGDAAPPSLSVSLRPQFLWPANHRLVPVHARVEASDDCGEVSVVLVSITSSEPGGGPGDNQGSAAGDMQGVEAGTADYDFLLRAERSGDGPGRTYTVTYRATDAAGNSSTASATVLVPHDRGRRHRSDSPDGSGGGKP